MPLKSYKICSKIFEHGFDPPPLLNNVKKTADLVEEGTPYKSYVVSWFKCSFSTIISELFLHTLSPKSLSKLKLWNPNFASALVAFTARDYQDEKWKVSVWKLD